MARYRAKPIIVEAERIQLSVIPMLDGSFCARNNPFDAVVMRRPRWFMSKVPMVNTINGWVAVNPGDYIVRDTEGRYYPRNPKVFEAKYEKVDDRETGGVTT